MHQLDTDSYLTVFKGCGVTNYGRDEGLGQAIYGCLRQSLSPSSSSLCAPTANRLLSVSFSRLWCNCNQLWQRCRVGQATYGCLRQSLSQLPLLLCANWKQIFMSDFQGCGVTNYGWDEGLGRPSMAAPGRVLVPAPSPFMLQLDTDSYLSAFQDCGVTVTNSGRDVELDKPSTAA